ncbi:hypothetical protein, partial [Plasticicumulans sp.]|uniref:hypothetical protein n=1 Tax=Plasticicumulans sp. TaxID=2307179 RepID=UPI002B8E8254
HACQKILHITDFSDANLRRKQSLTSTCHDRHNHCNIFCCLTSRAGSRSPPVHAAAQMPVG